MIFFKPNGTLNVATDPSDLPEQASDRGSFSDALVRFKNLRHDLKGVAKLRDGSKKLNTVATSGGTELVTNGTFDSSLTGWTTSISDPGSVTWVGGAMRVVGYSSPPLIGYASAYQAISTSVGSTCHFTCAVLNSGTNVSTSFTATASTTYVRFYVYNNILSISVGITLGGTDFLHQTVSGYSYYDIDNVSLTGGSGEADAVNLLVEQGGVRYGFAGESIFRNESSLVDSLTNAQWSAILYNSYNDTNQSLFALNGTDRKRITDSTVAEWGIAAPSAPTTAVGALTGLTGTYNTKVTYCRKVGSTVVYESNPSSAGTARALTNQSLSVTWAASSDTQVTHVRVYRTLANGAIYYHDRDVAVGTTTVDTNTADSALGSEVETDHDRPPLGTVVIGPSFAGTCFILKDNNLYYCKPKQPEYWPSDYYIEVSTLQYPLTAGVFHNGQLYVFTEDELYYIQGTGHGTFFPIKMKASAGAQSAFGAVSVPGKGIYHTGKDGIYLWSSEDKKITEANLEPLFRGEDTQGMPGVSTMDNSWLHQHSNKLYFGYVSADYNYPSNVLVMNLDTGRIGYYQYNDGSVVQLRCITTDKTNNRILAGDTTGYVRILEDKSVSTDSGQAVSWEAQSKDFTLQTRAHFPRWNKYDVDASSATTCNGYLLLDGAVHQTHAITGNRNTVRRLVKTGNGERCAIRLSGSGPVSIYAVESE